VAFVAAGGRSWVWNKYHSNREDLSPLLTLAAAVGVAGVALLRHFAQTSADRQRRITESFSKAVEQLSSDKIEARLGGIYTLEQISKESANDYWTVIETLTAFVRERARWKESDTVLMGSMARFYENAEERRENDKERSLPTDIAAVLTVINRRAKSNRKREVRMGWRLDLRNTDLRGAYLQMAHLEGAFLTGTHLQDAWLVGAHLQGAWLLGAHLQNADLMDAFLEGANLQGAFLQGTDLQKAHLEGATLWVAHLQGANLSGVRLQSAHLEGAYLKDTHLEGAHLGGANLRHATELEDQQLVATFGNAWTRLPDGVTRPAHWPPEAPQDAAELKLEQFGAGVSKGYREAFRETREDQD
jgi:uncharacterized protein YjbI with pentapeptide repeats